MGQLKNIFILELFTIFLEVLLNDRKICCTSSPSKQIRAESQKYKKKAGNLLKVDNKDTKIT